MSPTVVTCCGGWKRADFTTVVWRYWAIQQLEVLFHAIEENGSGCTGLQEGRRKGCKYCEFCMREIERVRSDGNCRT